MTNHSFSQAMGEVNTVLFTELVAPVDEYRYLEDQRELLQIAQHSPGFINADFLCPIPGIREEWLTILQFDREDHLNNYLSSRDLEALSARKNYLQDNKRQLLSNFSQKASMLITTTLKPENEENWLKWNDKINQAMRRFPGFIESDIQPSKIEQKANNKTWIVNFQFDTLDHLNHWLNSPERKALIEEGSSLYEASVVSQFPSGFSSWFDVRGKTSAVASWKMPIIVEMSLYPLVLAQAKLTGFLNIFPLPVVILINTFYGCFLLQYLLIPMVQKGMKFWLHPQDSRATNTNFLGIALAAVYLLLICQVMIVLFK